MSESRSQRAEMVARSVAGGRFRRVEWVLETGSTNADLLQAGRQGAPEQVRIADHQSAGRGRRDRQWFSPPDAALMMSVLVRHGVAPDRLSRVTIAMGLAALDGLAEVCGVSCMLKWPNDVLVDERKLAGILAESALGAEPFVVVGIGLNVTQDAVRSLPDEIATRATCVADHATVTHQTRANLAASILGSFENWLGATEPELLAAYSDRLATIGQKIVVTRDTSEPLRGLATAVTRHGELVVRVNGTDHTVTAGDVSHVRPSS